MKNIKILVGILCLQSAFSEDLSVEYLEKWKVKDYDTLVAYNEYLKENHSDQIQALIIMASLDSGIRSWSLGAKQKAKKALDLYVERHSDEEHFEYCKKQLQNFYNLQKSSNEQTEKTLLPQLDEETKNKWATEPIVPNDDILPKAELLKLIDKLFTLTEEPMDMALIRGFADK